MARATRFAGVCGMRAAEREAGKRLGALAALALLCVAGASARPTTAAHGLSWDGQHGRLHRAPAPRASAPAPRASALTRALRGGASAVEGGESEGGLKPLGPAHAAFLQTFEQFLEAFGAALEKACTTDKGGGLFGGRASKKAHLKPDRAAMQQAYNHMHDLYTSGLLGARSPQTLVLSAMQVRRAARRARRRSSAPAEAGRSLRIGLLLPAAPLTPHRSTLRAPPRRAPRPASACAGGG